MAKLTVVLPEGAFEIDSESCPVRVPDFNLPERDFAHETVRFLRECAAYATGTGDAEGVAYLEEMREAIEGYICGTKSEQEVDEVSRRVFHEVNVRNGTEPAYNN
jgi:hypothetical protein